MIKLLNYLLISGIFTGAFVFNNGCLDFYISYVFLVGFLLAYIFFCGKIHFERNFFYILSIIFFLSLINVFQGNNAIHLLLKVMFGFILNGIAYYSLFRLNGYNVDELFRVYLRIACVVALIGIFQEISFLLGFERGYDFRYFIPRIVAPHLQLGMLSVTSIMQEPAHFGAAMMPAFFVSVVSLLRWKNNFISGLSSSLIVLSVLLTFSIVAYIGISTVVVLILFNSRKVKVAIIGIIILFVFAFTMYRYLPVVKWKVDDTIAVIIGEKAPKNANLSTWSFFSNGFVAYKSFKRNPLFGSGLGSHPMSYDRYIGQIINPAENRYVLNKGDASGLFFRLISETGLVGIFLFFYFVIKFYIPRGRDEYFWIISNSIFCLFILNLLRQGNYFYNGFFFFIWAYYFTYRNMCIKADSDCQTRKE